jgi:hypothetical protein
LSYIFVAEKGLVTKSSIGVRVLFALGKLLSFIEVFLEISGGIKTGAQI